MTQFVIFQPFPERQILDSSNLKEIADGNFHENGRRFSKRVENTVERMEKLLITDNFSFSQSFFFFFFPFF